MSDFFEKENSEFFDSIARQTINQPDAQEEISNNHAGTDGQTDADTQAAADISAPTEPVYTQTAIPQPQTAVQNNGVFPPQMAQPAPMQTRPASVQQTAYAPMPQIPTAPIPKYNTAPPVYPVAPVYMPPAPQYIPAVNAQPMPQMYNRPPMPNGQMPYAPQPIAYPPQQPVGYPVQQTAAYPDYTVKSQQNAIAQPIQQKEEKKKGKVGRILLIIGSAIVGLALLFFAVYGIIAMANGTGKKASNENSNTKPDYHNEQTLPDDGNTLPDLGGNQGQNQLPDIGNDFGGGVYGFKLPESNPSDLKLGIVVGNVSEQLVETYGVPKGLFIIQIEDDSSLKSDKVQIGDIITQADGKKVETTEELHAVFNDHKAGDTIKLMLTRLKEDGSLYSFEFEAVLQANEQSTDEQSSQSEDGGFSRPVA